MALAKRSAPLETSERKLLSLVFATATLTTTMLFLQWLLVNGALKMGQCGWDSTGSAQRSKTISLILSWSSGRLLQKLLNRTTTKPPYKHRQHRSLIIRQPEWRSRARVSDLRR